MSKSLVAFDTDQVTDYVFSTSTLKEIRGASALLDYLNRVEMPHLVSQVSGTRVYANGGGGLFTVNTKHAEQIIQDVRRAYSNTTQSASVTGVALELPDSVNDDVPDQLDILRYRLRVAKDTHDTPVSLVTHPLLRFCDSCGVRYATKIQNRELLCPSCLAKREQNRHVTASIQRWAKPQAQLNPDSPYLWERLIANLKEQDYPVFNFRRPEDFDAFGRLSSPGGYMGLIYADGDGMGHEIEKIKTLDAMHKFANVVDESIYLATTEAIIKHLQPTQGNTWPFDILLLGGDDLVMVTRAQSAVEVALHIVQRFPELIARNWDKPLNLSASVVLAHVKYPIGSLLKLAKSGLKFAKKAAVQRRQKGETLTGGLLNFLVVSSANHLDFGEYYAQVFKQRETNESWLYRTCRPYTTAGMHNLLDKIHKAHRIPRTKLEQLRAAVFKSRQQGTLDAMLAALRSRKEITTAIFNLIESEDEQSPPLNLPWINSGDTRWVTPILDVVELLDFVERRSL